MRHGVTRVAADDHSIHMRQHRQMTTEIPPWPMVIAVGVQGIVEDPALMLPPTGTVHACRVAHGCDGQIHQPYVGYVLIHLWDI